MNPSFRFFVLGLALCFAATAAQAAAPAVVEVQGKSGVKAWLVEDHALPLVSLRFSFEGGVEQDPADKQGLSILAASLLTQGAGPYDDKAFQSRLAARSIQMDIAASRDYLEGEVKTLAREKKEAFRLLSLALTQPRFDKTSFDRVRMQQKTAQKMQKAKAEWQGRFALYQEIFGPHPYGYRSLGTSRSLDALTAQDAKAFTAQLLAQSGLKVAIVGDVTPQEASAALDQIFGSLPRAASSQKLPDVVWPSAPASVQVRREGTQTDIQFALPMPRRDDPDWYAAEIANYILGGGGFVSRLMSAVREQEGLTYGIHTGLAPMRHASLLSGSLSSDNDKAAKAVARMKEVWADFYANGPTESEIEAAKNFLSGSLPLSLTSTDALSGVLLMMQQEGLGRDYLETRKAKLEAVTSDAVRRVVRAWFDPKGISFSYVGMPLDLAADKTQDMILE